MPVVLLVSNGTAHAAEVFAAALANHDRATLIGEPTAGIAAIQRLFTLPQGHGLWLTTERYIQTDGTPIHGPGLPPDVPMAIPTVAFGEEPPTADPLLDRAKEELSGTGSARQGASPATAAPTSPAGERGDRNLPATTPPSSPR
jgi:carboxyl-terminal processing protease